MTSPKLPPLPRHSWPFGAKFNDKDMNAHYLKGYNDAIAATQAQGVPDGWQLVPKEPTDAMIRAALHLDLSYMPGHDGPDRAAVYKAMLTSAPPAPQAKPQPLDVKKFARAIKSAACAERDQRIAELEERNRDLYEDVQRFKEHALNEKAARLELERQLEEARKVYRAMLVSTPPASQASVAFCTYPKCQTTGMTCAGTCARADVAPQEPPQKPQPLSADASK